MQSFPKEIVVSRANGEPTELETTVSRANGTPTELETAVARANGKATELETAVARANGTPTELETAVSRANGTPTKLETAVSRANGKGTELETEILLTSNKATRIMAKQMNELRLAGLPNTAHYDYMQQFYEWILASPLAEKLKTELATFKTAFDEEDRCLKISQTSAYTKQIEEQDGLRDAAYMGFKGAVKSFRNFPAGDMKDAAETLWQLIVDYKVDVEAQLNVESGAITNLLQDLEGKCAAEVEKLSLKLFVEQMKSANEQVRTLMANRHEENSAKVAGETKAARAAVDEAYRELRTKSNAYAVIEGDTDYAAFFDKMNSMIDYYKEHVLGQKKSSSSSSSGGDSSSTDDNGSSDSSSDSGSDTGNDSGSSDSGSDSGNDSGSSDSGDGGSSSGDDDDVKF